VLALATGLSYIPVWLLRMKKEATEEVGQRIKSASPAGGKNRLFLVTRFFTGFFHFH
jgi:hypothetical protein